MVRHPRWGQHATDAVLAEEKAAKDKNAEGRGKELRDEMEGRECSSSLEHPMSLTCWFSDLITL